MGYDVPYKFAKNFKVNESKFTDMVRLANQIELAKKRYFEPFNKVYFSYGYDHECFMNRKKLIQLSQFQKKIK